MYRSAVDGYITKGHAEEIAVDEDVKKEVWYLPHHPVHNPNKPNKVRVVFDAAAVYQSTSLNQQLLKGPDYTNRLVGVLLRFRQYPVAVVGDIEAMFHQVRVLPDDTDRLRFLWWKDGLDRPPSIFRMLVHIFGATSSPCCASYCVQRTVTDNQDQFDEKTIAVAKHSFYVDDMLTSVATVNDAKNLVMELRALLKLGHFNLTKWMSNERSILRELPREDVAPSMTTKNMELDGIGMERALGILWQTETDTFMFKVKDQEKPNTKRGMLSTIGTLYDPLGFLSPVLLKPKMMLQSLWRQNCDWDDPLPANVEQEWKAWVQELPQVEKVAIPRCYTSTFVEVELHIFADASELGYGCASYLRFAIDNNAWHVSLVFGKSRVAPVKAISIPRLELQGATIASRIGNMLQSELDFPIKRCTYWIDSMTVLGYIHNLDKRFHTFVANRISEIRERTSPDDWRYVPTQQNPADDASRGVAPGELVTSQQWFHGPSFLQLSEERWPVVGDTNVNDEDPEVKREKQCYAQVETGNKLLSLVSECSNFQQVKRSVAWLKRYTDFVADSKNCCTGPLSVDELDSAEILASRVVQQGAYQQEIKQLQSARHVANSSSIQSLHPILKNGLLRVGGRIQRSTLCETAKHPVILPAAHPLSLAIVWSFHKSNSHCGVEATITAIRERFWIVGVRKLVKQAIRHCLLCKRYNARTCSQFMAPLPEARLVPFDPPFTRTGVDYFGPIEVTSGRETLKRYGCLFTCLNTRAIHLEISPSLDADDFINTLRQFISRRGPVQEIWSDNGTNFVGANRELKDALSQLNSGIVESTLKEKGIKWKFQTPLASHMSGVWERMVGVVKKHLKILCGVRSLDEHRLRTFLAEVEYVVNSRPITPSSDSPDDLEALTPNHFLLLRKCQTPLLTITQKGDIWSRRRWRQVQHLTDCFWQRWLREYLPSLQKRVKWTKPERNLQCGDLVLVICENVARCKWPLGRITKVFPGPDGFVRSVELKMASGTYTRPIAKLCLLEATV
jgi:hypothetical protein